MPLNFLRSMLAASDKPLGGRYQIVEQLGAGGFGQTFKAHDLHLPGHPLCVVKQLKPQVSTTQELQVAHRLFDTEARTLYTLGNHPQIPRLLAHFSSGKNFYLAQELIDGHALTDELDGTAWEPLAVVALLGDILETLAFVHDNRVIHRDLKPSNLIRRHSDNRIVVIDFGAVKEASTQIIQSNTAITHTVSIGTRGYMPNEQLAGTPYFSSDIYAIGMIGIQALTGQQPRLLTADSRTGEIDWHHLRPDAPAKLMEFLDQMVKYDFRARYATATEALQALQSLPDELHDGIPNAPVRQLEHPGSSHPKAGNPLLTNSHSPSSSHFAGSDQLPITQSETANTLPMTAPETVAAPPPSRHPDISRNGDTVGYGVAHRPHEETLPVLGDRPFHTQPLDAPSETHRLSPSGRSSSLRTTSPRPRLSEEQRSLTRMAIPVMAIATVLGGGLFAWRTFVSPDPVPPSTLSSGDARTLPLPDGPPESATSAPNSLPSPSASLPQILQRARRLRNAENYGQALVAFDEAIALDGNSSAAHAGRCYSLNRLERYEDAIVACDRAIALDATNAEAFLSKGYALDQQEQYADAIALYDQALAINPDFAEAWSNKGTALYHLGNHQEAIAAFDRALALNPQLPEVWNNRGAALWDLREFSAALDSVDRALEIQPDYQDAAVLRQEMRKRLPLD